MATDSRDGAGGYDYKFTEQFVNTPLDRYFCVICQHPSRDPHLSVCCGHVFCKSCIDKVKAPCPMCRDENFVTFPNKQLDREIKNLDILCTNVERGCVWHGKLSKIDDHLGRNGDCQFEEVECTNKCGKAMQRRYYPSHVETECPCREVNCQYCHEIGEHQFIEGQHKEECPRYPVPCPNKCVVVTVPREDMERHRGECQLEVVNCSNDCGEKLKRQDLTSHVETKCLRRKVNCQYCHSRIEYQFIDAQHKEECPRFPLPCPNGCEIDAIPSEDMETHRNECPLEVIQCEYYRVGCETKMARVKKQTHDEKNIENHLMLTKQKLLSTEDKLANAIQQINALKFLMQTSVQWMVKLTTMATLFESGDQICPVILKVSEYSEKVKGDINWYTKSFYTHDMGYRMCLCIYAGGYAYGKGKGTHLSMFLYVMKGINDDNLTWSLQGKFEVKMLNQISDSEHLSVTISFDDSNEYHAERVTEGEMADVGWGERYELISNEDLHKATETCQFLKDNCVYFEVRFYASSN